MPRAHSEHHLSPNEMERATRALRYLGYLFGRESDRSTNVLLRAQFDGARAACVNLADVLRRGEARQNWDILAQLDAPEPPQTTKQPTKKFRPYQDSYSTWKYETRDEMESS